MYRDMLPFQDAIFQKKCISHYFGCLLVDYMQYNNVLASSPCAVPSFLPYFSPSL